MAQDLRPAKGYIGAELRAPAGFKLAYQTQDFGRRSFVDCPVALEAISDARLTAVFAHRQDGDQWHHWGDMLFDVDSKDIKESSETVLKIVDFLQTNYGVPGDSIHIWASGSKGYHLRLPASLFGDVFSELTHSLPVACKAFARHVIEGISGHNDKAGGAA